MRWQIETPVCTCCCATDESIVLSSAVNLFAHWLYPGKVPGYVDDDEWNKTTEVAGTTSGTDERFYVYLSAYIFGDKFFILQFRQTIQEAYGAYIMHEHVWGPRSVEAVTTAS